ncbi:MAG: hypothetical protein QXH07_02080 [Thermoplasmata archaeon]
MEKMIVITVAKEIMNGKGQIIGNDTRYFSIQNKEDIPKTLEEIQIFLEDKGSE